MATPQANGVSPYAQQRGAANLSLPGPAGGAGVSHHPVANRPLQLHAQVMAV